MKSIILKKKDISSVIPERYQERYVNFINGQVFTNRDNGFALDK